MQRLCNCLGAPGDAMLGATLCPLLLLLAMLESVLASGPDPQKTILQTTVPEKVSSSDVEKDPENHVIETPSLYVLPMGTIQFQNFSYGIEPVEAMSGFVHVIYEITNDDTEIPDSGEIENYSWFNASEFQFGSNSKKTTLTKLLPRYIEMDIVVDKKLTRIPATYEYFYHLLLMALLLPAIVVFCLASSATVNFDYMGSDVKVVTQKVIQVISLVNTVFSKLKLTVIINSIEIWSKENRISLPKNTMNLLIEFSRWKQDHKPHHVSYFLVFEEQPTSIGAVHPGELCRLDFDAVVALYPKGLSLESYSVIVSQLLSFGMGLTYDNTDTCHCTGDGMKDFSTCSLDDFKSLSTSKTLRCLQDWPMERRPPRRKPRRICGNGIVEGKEQCDCGTLENCTHKACCDPLLCRLKPDAVCGSGECCTQHCRIKAIDTLCRKKRDECDFEEYCNGTYSYCGPDTYLRNGEYCNSGESFCYGGVCRSSDQQCMKLLGKGVRGASFWCYEEMNSRGDKFGNCITQHCRLENVLCGKLICTWPYKHLLLKVNMSVAYAHVRDDICVSLHRSFGKPKQIITDYETIEDRDETFIEDGVICGPDMVCNNFHHCHCERGFTPPNCERMGGQFGSMDDGHKVFQ
ncbi:hypothetical protein A6R68_23203, partial [Neotoma lepida]